MISKKNKFIFIIIFAYLGGISSWITELNDHLYPSLVGTDRSVWLIDIASKMCSGCQEFHPEFEALAKSFPNVRYGVVYVEDKEGMKLVNKLKGVMDKGLPAVILVKDEDPYIFTQLVFGDVIKEKDLRKMVVPLVKDLEIVTGIYKRVPKNSGKKDGTEPTNNIKNKINNKIDL